MTKQIASALIMVLLSLNVLAQNAEQLLSRDMMTSRKVLKNTVQLYNYFTLTDVSDWIGNQQKRENYIKDYYLSPRAGTFWNSDFTDTSPKNYASGAGLYLAIDPKISEQYGNSFIRLTVPAGTAFINVVMPIPLKKDTLAALISEGIISKADFPVLFPRQTGFYRDTLRAMVDPKYSQFRQIVQNIMDENQIQFIEYNFNTALSGFCVGARTSAFLYIGLKNPNDVKKAVVTEEFSHTSVYSTILTMPNQSTVEVSTQGEIVKLRTLLTDILALRAAGKTIKKDFILSRLTSEEFAEAKSESYSCQP